MYLKLKRFRAFEVAGLLLSPIIGFFQEKIGRKNTIVIGYGIIVRIVLKYL